jgi:DNA-binding MurR/RpiR family transcriptional regulator
MEPAPTSPDAFGARLAALSPDLPRRLRQCADWLAAHLDRVALATVAEVAAGAEVPPSAVIRFCQTLGFAGWTDLQRLFRDAYGPGLPDYATRLANLQAQGAGTPARLLAEFVEAGRSALAQLAARTDETTLDQCVETLAAARVIHVAGFRRAFPVASYLAYVCDKLAVPAVLHDGVGALDRVHAMRPGDALVAITFAPYRPETIAIAAAARTRGLPVVALTDAPDSPVAAHATQVLCIAEVDFGAFRSLSSAIALALTLAVAVGAARDRAFGGAQNGIFVP